MTSFTVKDLRFTFTLANNAMFETSNNNVLTVNGLRARAAIKGAGFPAFPEAELAVFGLKQSDMNALTSLAFQPDFTARNTVLVEANNGQGFTNVFSGQIITSGPDYDGIPSVPLKMLARVLGFDSLNPADPSQFTGGTVSVDSIVRSIAAQFSGGGYVVENTDVTATLTNPYFSGTLTDQLRAVASQANIEVNIEGQVIAIRPKSMARNQTGFTLSPASGLVGYPKLDFQRGYVYIKSLFNPAFRFGGPITVQGSSVPLANGSWIIGTLSHELESQMPGGKWFSNLLLYPPGKPPPTS